MTTNTTRRRWCRATALTLATLVATAATARAADTLLGPVQQLKVLDDFGPASPHQWKAQSSANTTFTLASRVVPGVSDSLLQIAFTRKNDEKNAYFTLQRPLPANAITPDAHGLRLLLGSPLGGEWWMRLSVRANGKGYDYTMQTAFPDRTIIEQDIPFADFKSGDQALSPAAARHLESVSLLVAPHNGSIYLDQLSTYEQHEYRSWLSFASAHDSNNLFEPGEKVTATLTPGGTVPDGAKGFRYTVEDFFKKTVKQGTVTLDGAKSYPLDLTPPAGGFYELRTWWTDAAGKDLEDRSCLKATGSEPQGIATFSVLPRTREQNIQLMKKAGQNAFFGVHGDYLGLDDAIGATWRLGYAKWPYLEPKKPDRGPDAIAPWAQKQLAEPPAPSYEMHIHPFTANLAPPDWAKNPANVAPPYANWDDYLALVRDEVRVELHQYPQMHPHIYGAAWEVNLNFPPYNFKPPYTPADVVELYKRQRETIKALDPTALIVGPCPSNLNVAWFEKVFKAGVLQYLDGIESHGYAEGTFTPEEYDYPGKLAAIRNLMKQYNHGKVLPIYITEAAFRGILGTKIIYRQQAEVMTRLAIILKGEGVQAFLPFYSLDYDRDGWWGFQFNLEVDQHPWSTKHVSPKPTVNAMAVCIGELEGAKPVRRLTGLGKDVWAYDFNRDGTTVTAVWTQSGETPVTLNIGNGTQAKLVDIMGHPTTLTPTNGKVQLTATPAVQYLESAQP